MIKIVEHSPHRRTTLPGDIEVSSIHYDIFIDGRRVTHCNETMVFFGSGENEYSESFGLYEDHDKVVKKIQEI